MKKILLFFVFCYLCLPCIAKGSSEMVDRHIFTPAPEVKGLYKSPLSLKLEKDLMFTGVILSSRGNWAIIRESDKVGDTGTSGLRKEGDDIAGMVIKEIGKNYLILTEGGKDVRLNLYHEGKSRPPEALSPETPVSEASGAASVTTGQPGKEKTQASAPKEPPNPFRDAMEKMDQRQEKIEEEQPTQENPFLDAVQKSE
ncbi:exported hypothetical protein [uncultured Desulfobacterium sp.]|uniref:Type II secretion system protein GspC N-terminal domain-containing protein n=1 Tax=uncultured Desulfobacterium sp. TaxID=201089 RepID=A0A445MVS7_9BACT|nr:exported hypothetical protein [uncultured Desulfobacterium sp.]